MSQLSGYDSEAIGFDSVSANKVSEANMSTQTNFTETATSTQTDTSEDFGCNATPYELNAEDQILQEYPPPGLNEFLRRVVPSMMEQLDEGDTEVLYNSSDSEEEEMLTAKLFQELEVMNDMPSLGAAGDYGGTVLGVTWSSAGNTLAVSIGQPQHVEWCQHDGLIRVYTVKRSEQDKLVHTLDISEKNCISVLQYHPSAAGLLAYGTTSGEVVLCNLRDLGNDEGIQLSSPLECHGSKRVSALHWADATLTNTFLTIEINKSGKRRRGSDQVLVSAGSDGTVNIWKVNSNYKTFKNMICYKINNSHQSSPPDITCLDFIKTFPLRPTDEKVSDDIFVVGTKSGKLYLCKIKKSKTEEYADVMDPVYEVLEGHSTCVLGVVFSFQKPGVFVSVSIDSELRIYNVNQNCPLKILCLDSPISCMSWLPNNPCIVLLGEADDGDGNPCIVLLGEADDGDGIKVHNVRSGRPVPVDGLTGGGVTSMAVAHTGVCRIAAGDFKGRVRIWDFPTRRIKLLPEDIEF